MLIKIRILNEKIIRTLMATHNELGIEGEKRAVIHLQKQGYTILETNYRFQKAEADIIAQKADTLAVVEVKSRTSADFGNPEEFVNKKKIKLLVKAVDQYINENDLDVEVRFDVIAILFQKNEVTLNHIEDAFYHF
jgi:putative endonuclease